MGSDTVDWLKKVSASKAKVSFEMEEDSEVDSFAKPKANAIKSKYTSKDLTGLHVSHDFGSFQAGQSDILVLEDASVFGEERNALVSMNLKEDARLKRLREVSRHASGYSGYKEYEEEQAEDSVVTLGQARPAKILQKYDFASTDFNDEPGVEGFRLGSEQKKTEEPKLRGLSDFDTVQSAGIETINMAKRNKNNMESEKKRAKKLAKTFFADEPEMIVDSEEHENFVEKMKGEDDDFDMQRVIAATRREHLKTANPQFEDFEKDRFIGGKSFDSLIMSESIFAKTVVVEDEGALLADSMIIEDDNEDISSDFSEQEEAFSAEPLVRNGVASTLALLNMRGINLKPRSSSGSTKQQFKDNNSDIKLEYFDQFGNKLNSKEAYKELSRKFHGKGPVKGKLEKMKRRREETLKIENVSASAATQSAIVQNLRKQQEDTGAPYMILSNTRQSEPVQVANISVASAVKKPRIFGLQTKK